MSASNDAVVTGLRQVAPVARVPYREHDVLHVVGIDGEGELAEREEITDAEAVELHVAPDGRDQVDGVAGARGACLQRSQRGEEHQTLILGALEVATRQRVAGAADRERFLTVHVPRPGGEVSGRVVVVDVVRHVDIDAADLVHHVDEVREVHADHVRDGKAGDARHRVGFGAQAEVVTTVDDVGVDLGAARALGVARDVEDGGRTQCGVDADHVDGVGQSGIVVRFVRIVGARAGSQEQGEEGLVRRGGVARACHLGHLEPHCARGQGG